MEDEETQIRIKKDSWEKLNARKKMGESFSEVIARMCLECPEEKQK